MMAYKFWPWRKRERVKDSENEKAKTRVTRQLRHLEQQLEVIRLRKEGRWPPP